jgi:hypothetical protein
MVYLMGVILFSGPVAANPVCRIAVVEEGIYKVGYEDLLSAGISPETIAPERVALFNGGGRELPRDVETTPPVLQEIPLFVCDNGTQGVFDETDYFLFYGRALKGWEPDEDTGAYVHYINHYTDENIYWLILNGPESGKRMRTVDGGPDRPDALSPVSFRAREHYEVECRSLAGDSGIEWYWERVQDLRSPSSFRIFLFGVATSDSCTIRAKLITEQPGRVKLKLNEHEIAQEESSKLTRSFIVEGGEINCLEEGENTLQIVIVGAGDTSFLLDWFEIEYSKRFIAHKDELEFFVPRGDEMVEYKLTGFIDSGILLFEITDQFDVVRIENATITEQDGCFQAVFQDRATDSTVKKYAALTDERMKTPVQIEIDEPSNWRDPSNGADYLIIVHDDFYENILPLKHLRETRDGLSVEVVKISDVYDEFSWGLFDPTAIRNFLKYAYEHWATVPQYVLFVGDGDYDFKNNSGKNAGNWIPPYENERRCSDDWFVFFDENRQMGTAMGRIPAQSPCDVDVVVGKIIEYETNLMNGKWKNDVLFIADDDFIWDRSSREIDFVIDTEQLSGTPMFVGRNVSKVYLTDYPLDEWKHKPMAAERIIEEINKGKILVNYVGHGFSGGIAHEHALRTSRDLPRLHNSPALPLFYFASCSVGRFDRLLEQSMAEALLLAEDKGAVAVIAATRPNTHHSNMVLNKSFYQHLVADLTIGQALRQAKLQNHYDPYNNEQYHIFGDPALRVQWPDCEVQITAVDTLKALGSVTISGKVQQEGVDLPHFEGTVYLEVFDSMKEIAYPTASRDTLDYLLPGSTIFRGTAEVENGAFQMGFFVPKDLTYCGETARIHAYVWNDYLDGAGYRDSIFVGGTESTADDDIPPIIALSIPERSTNSDTVFGSVTIQAGIFDSNGINLTGAEGHQITLRIDDEDTTQVDLTEFFEYDRGSCTQGKLVYQLTDIPAGWHNIELKAWDNFNNSGMDSLSVFVESIADDSETPAIFSLSQNYPNPFNQSTSIEYQIPEEGKVTLKVYNILGQTVCCLVNGPRAVGKHSVRWDGRDDRGMEVASGTYFYRLQTGEYVNVHKMLLLR